MAAKPMNMVDAVAATIPRIARNRSAVLRFGRVATAPASGMVKVTVGTGDVTCAYAASYVPVVGDWVGLLNDGDRWIVLDRVATASDVGGRNLGYTEQVSEPPFTSTGTYVDFTTAAWPYLTFTVPRSGRLTIIVSGYVINNNSAGSTCYINWRLTGGAYAALGHTALMGSASPIRASKVVPVYGCVPGAAYTLIPVWYISSGTATTATIIEGVIAVDAAE